MKSILCGLSAALIIVLGISLNLKSATKKPSTPVRYVLPDAPVHLEFAVREGRISI